MRNRGFTLIEVIVAMSIISIMAGILVPISYKIWDAQKEDLTRSRMETLKKAMVGDPALYQNGMRTDYGFVGDNGELPIKNGWLDELIPYLGGGFNSDKYNKDAWGGDLAYEPSADLSAATLVSSGPNRSSEVGFEEDDIELTIGQREVLPTGNIIASLTYTVRNTYNVGILYSARVKVSRETGGTTIENGACIPINIGSLPTEAYTDSGSVTDGSDFSQILSVGKFTVSGILYKDGSCAVDAAASNEVVFFVSPGQQDWYVNLRFPPVVH